VFATLGAYSLHQSVVDLVTLYVFGLLGFGMPALGVPVAPAVIGLILGLAEPDAARAVDQPGRPSVFITQPISAALFLLTAIILFAPWSRARCGGVAAARLQRGLRQGRRHARAQRAGRR